MATSHDRAREIAQWAREELSRRPNTRKLYGMYPDEGPLRRELYPKHLEFFAAGAIHQERAFIAGNRVGKTAAGSYEVACHAIGYYPHWWIGKRFDRAVSIWVAGEDTKAVRESLQETLFGPPGMIGTGMIPADMIVSTMARSGVPGAIDVATIKNFNGHTSRLLFKTYDQGRESFQASKVDVMMFDEEPPMPIYTEGITRTMSTVPGQPSGIVMCTFTPLKGLSAVVLSYMPGGQRLDGALPDVVQAP
jgi:phage terminase large subunit-like protein